MPFKHKELTYKANENGCWICTSHSPNGKGYIVIKRGEKRVYAHRYMYTQHKGAIPDGMVVRHSCDVRNCINPDHLSIGTVQDNTNDRVERDRGACGEKIDNSKLNEQQVKFIRKHKQITTIELANVFGVSDSSISRARNGTSWKHLLKSN